MLVSSITVTVAVTKWFPDFMLRFQIPENIQEKLEEEGVSYTPFETIEQEGMAISMEKCLTDNESYYCLFKVTLPEGVKKGMFQNVSVEGYRPEDFVDNSDIKNLIYVY